MNEVESLISSIKELTSIDEKILSDEVLAEMLAQFNLTMTDAAILRSINQMLVGLEEQGLTKADAIDSINALKEYMQNLFYGENEYTGNKKILIDTVTEKLFNVFDKVAEQYHSYNIVLPMTLEDGATVPTYAHETDAAADLYALEDTELKGNSIGNKIRTGVSIQLPEGWLALIIPRSSIGAKTPLRLSNSVGLIDSGYRGELGVLYDNISDEVYNITKGDRIAQLLVMPSYRFQANVVDSLKDSDRGIGGFGSTGT